MNPKLIDIHTHSDNQSNEIISVKNTPPDFFGSSFYYSTGIHPWDVEKSDIKDLQILLKHSENANFIAMGEIGLDKIKAVDFQKQLKFFTGQLELAEKLNKPLIIHCVRTYSEILSVRKDYNKTPWIIHGFNANQDIAEKLISKNCYLSFGSLLFNEKSGAFKVFNQVNTDSIFLETDDSGKKIEEMYQMAARITNNATSHLKEKIYNNFVSCFKPCRDVKNTL
ncbi:MAG: hypothetical protein A2W91_04695 [Bacteroidetes bacterium GWF2_38_335]|nr:MAG: hypothetical protein A2W91_04695 [Bacteroidetes bacterium GWF2_38_335]OFY80032.1 MAG: hypothetical protein A2281_12160 [Bacteroidetes bacterium RIFOXYA12_FULL_38_20]HBS85230.1 hypothetical protein [Bacteroidales bacterium]